MYINDHLKFYLIACPAILFYWQRRWSFLLVFHLNNHSVDSYSHGQVYFLDSDDFALTICYSVLDNWVLLVFRSVWHTMITLNLHYKTAPHTTVHFVTQTRVQVNLPWGGEFVLRLRNANLRYQKEDYILYFNYLCFMNTCISKSLYETRYLLDSYLFVGSEWIFYFRT